MFQGSLVALVTPMQNDGSVDKAALKQLLDWHVEQGTDGIISMGTTGESATLDHSEHMAVVELTLDYVDGRCPVIAGTGSNSTAEAVALTRSAKAAGAAAALLVTPYYNKPTQEGLYQHYMKVADSVDLPQLLYNVPGRTAVDMLAETTVRLSSHENIVGTKEATGELPRLKTILAATADAQFAVYSGDDETAMEFMLAGARGNISVTANVAPAAMAAMSKAAIAGDGAGAELLNNLLQPLHQNLFVESNPMPVKWAVSELGLCGPTLRLPLTPLSAEYHEQLRDAMRTAGVLPQ